MTTIRFHPARWSPYPSYNHPVTGRYIYGTYRRFCVTCDKWIGDDVPLPMLSELTLFEAPDGCCYHEYDESTEAK